MVPPYRGLDVPCDLLGAGEVPVAPVRDVEVALLDPARLEPVREAAKGRHDFAAHPVVQLEVRRHEDCIGTPAERLYAGHRGPQAVAPGLVARGEDDAAWMLAGIRADDDGLALQLRILPDLDGGVEGVHVHVQHDARSGGRRSHGPSSWTGPGIKSFAAGERRSNRPQNHPKNARAASLR